MRGREHVKMTLVESGCTAGDKGGRLMIND